MWVRTEEWPALMQLRGGRVKASLNTRQDDATTLRTWKYDPVESSRRVACWLSVTGLDEPRKGWH